MTNLTNQMQKCFVTKLEFTTCFFMTENIPGYLNTKLETLLLHTRSGLAFSYHRLKVFSSSLGRLGKSHTTKPRLDQENPMKLKVAVLGVYINRSIFIHLYLPVLHTSKSDSISCQKYHYLSNHFNRTVAVNFVQ